MRYFTLVVTLKFFFKKSPLAQFGLRLFFIFFHSRFFVHSLTVTYALVFALMYY